jgi:hypothetical protein
MHLTSYLLVTSQVLFYLFILSDALKAISLDSFFEQRKAIDSLMHGRFKLMYYSCLAISVVTVLVAASNPSSSFFISSLIALILLIVDLVITMKGSLPLNAIAHTYAPGSDSLKWEILRTEWLTYMKYRGIVITSGMAALMTALVFGKT